jgi:hypothetical protein
MKKIFLFLSMIIIITLACDVSVNISPTSEVLTAATTPIPVIDPPTTTPEVFIARTQAVPAQVQLNGVILAVQEAQLGECDLPNCPPAPAGTRYLRVPLQALNIPTDQFLDYKNLPQGIAIHDNTGTITPFNRLAAFAPATQQLTLYFVVPETADVFGLQWPDTTEIPLAVTISSTSDQGTAVTYEPLSLVIPPDVASGASGSQLPRVDGEDAAYWQKTPGHLQVSLGDYYALQGKFHEPQIYVYPALDYAQLVPAAFESMHRLRNVMNKPDTSISADQLPAVPFFNAAQIFASNFQAISFQNGDGVRFLTEYAQYAAPVNNHELIYHFQGFTSDGEYYIIAILPITAPGLADTSDAGAPLPPGGVPYPSMADPNVDMQSYYASVTDLLNSTPPEAFTPTISQLDSLIRSMRVTP